MEYGRKLVILGILVAPGADGFECRLDADKARKCLRAIEQPLENKVLHPGCAQKLAGRLSWASLFLFRRLGRAMLRPLFKRAHGWYNLQGCAGQNMCAHISLQVH